MVKVGEIYKNNIGNIFEVIKVENYRNVRVKFTETGFECDVRADHVLEGRIKDKLHPSCYGVGYIGDLKGVKVNKKLKRQWLGMLTRCYDLKYKELKPTYKDCKVSEFFKSFSNFQDWCFSQKGWDNDGWELDKDLLGGTKKLYSEDNCVFVPREINVAIAGFGEKSGARLTPQGNRYQSRVNMEGKSVHLGYYDTLEDAEKVYIEAKIKYLRYLGSKWDGKVDNRVTQALINWGGLVSN